MTNGNDVFEIRGTPGQQPDKGPATPPVVTSVKTVLRLPRIAKAVLSSKRSQLRDKC